jgi:anaerobic ribonucleoside-triphosphate reductase activating protein
LAFAGGTEYHVDDLISAMRQSQHDHQIEGMTLLGGEPFAHAVAGAMLAEAAHACGLSVMIFSGYWLEDLQSKPDPATQQLLQHCDLLVDGPYVRELPDTTRRWIGSQNQRIHFLTDRYRADDPCWAQRNTLEIRVKNNEVLVNGFPAAQAKALWRGWKRTAREVPS